MFGSNRGNSSSGKGGRVRTGGCEEGKSCGCFVSGILRDDNDQSPPTSNLGGRDVSKTCLCTERLVTVIMIIEIPIRLANNILRL
mmetsp:Transcript_2058/g.3031  ORF Transcript_2058/g.3031 Transcript_2058/m.3031 type:complete len:85 (+) Transcript_2058:332-586(+)